jgi:hypothetical protein
MPMIASSGGGYAHDDDAASPFDGEAGGCHSDDDRIVPGEHHVDDDHRQQRAELIYAGQHPRHISIAARIVEAPAAPKFAPLPLATRLPAVPGPLGKCAFLTRYLVHRGCESAALVALATA